MKIRAARPSEGGVVFSGMEMPVVSVILPTYNRLAYLREAIESVLRGEYSDFEIIVVDDGSTEADPGAVVAAVGDPRVRCIRRAVNGGLPAARNTGLAEARGEYIAFLDDDDLLLPGKLASQVKYLEENQDVGLVAGGYIEADRELAPLRAVLPWSSSRTLDLRGCLLECPFVVCAVLVRREWLERVGGFDEQLRWVEDWDLWLRLAAEGCRMTWLPDVVCHYRVYADNMIRNAPAMRAGRVRALDKLFQQRDLPSEITALKDGLYAEAYGQGALREYAAGQMEAARADLEQAVFLSPRLLDGSPPPLIHWAIRRAANPATEDPGAFVRAVFANLPPSAESLRLWQPRALRDACLLSAVEAARVGNSSLAERRMKQAAEASIGQPPEDFLNALAEYVAGLTVKDPARLLTQVMEYLPDLWRKFRPFRLRAQARVFVASAFASHQRADRPGVRRALWQALTRDPRWLANRGVWAIGVRSLLVSADMGSEG